MSAVIQQERNYLTADAFALHEVNTELAHARAKFATGPHTWAALMEELGELSQALIDFDFGKQGRLEVRREAIQTACMAVRVCTEGDPDFALVRGPGAEPLGRSTDRVLAHAAVRLECLRAEYPVPKHALLSCSASAVHLGFLLKRLSGTKASVEALEGAGIHCAAWAVRIAIEGDAAFGYLAETRG